MYAGDCVHLKWPSYVSYEFGESRFISFLSSTACNQRQTYVVWEINNSSLNLFIQYKIHTIFGDDAVKATLKGTLRISVTFFIKIVKSSFFYSKKYKPLVGEFLANRNHLIDFQIFQKAFSCTNIGLVDMFVADLVEIDQIVFSPPLSTDI